MPVSFSCKSIFVFIINLQLKKLNAQFFIIKLQPRLFGIFICILVLLSLEVICLACSRCTILINILYSVSTPDLTDLKGPTVFHPINPIKLIIIQILFVLLCYDRKKVVLVMQLLTFAKIVAWLKCLINIGCEEMPTG